MKTLKGVLMSTLLSICLYAAKATAPVNDLNWLSGTWKLEADGKIVEEHWTTPGGGAMLGISRTIKNGKMVEFEFLRIEQREDSMVYIAQPQGGPPTEFRLDSAKATEVVFANPQHDFPQRIRYRHNPDGSLTARIEDVSGKKGMDFHYARSQ
jgi:Domain of unknown function (DUF6265)